MGKFLQAREGSKDVRMRLVATSGAHRKRRRRFKDESLQRVVLGS
jgi:hypothetical protein